MKGYKNVTCLYDPNDLKVSSMLSVQCTKNEVFIKDLVTFTEEILNGKLHFLCRGNIGIYKIKVIKRFRNLASVRRRHKDILQEIYVLIILNKPEFFKKCTSLAEALFEFRKVFN